MARHMSPNNQTSVPVLDQRGAPLSPTRPSRARTWLESGRAVKKWKNGHFAVQLTGGTTETNTEGNTPANTSLNINPGTAETGVAIVLNKPDGSAQVIAAYELHHRGRTITQRMTARSVHRRNRRGRIRRRPARFNNRARRPGWLPPSLKSILANVLTNVRHFREIFPITTINIESCKFDPRLMQDPDVYAAQYQTSERGQMQVREYVLQRDNRTCQYRKQCDGKNKRLETDHIVPRSQNGSDRVSNLLTSCRKCNQAKGSLSVEEFLADDPAGLRRVRAQLQKSLASATHMNQLMPLLIQGLKDTHMPVTQHDAVTTAHTRKGLGIAKTHVNDAASLGEPAAVTNIPKTVTIIQSVGHGRRQMLWPPSKHGTPRYKPGPEGRHSPYRAYCRISREEQGRTTMPGHRLRQRRTHGITSGDLVRYTHPRDGPLRGYAVLSDRNTRVSAGTNHGVKAEHATLLARNNGYRHHTGANETPAHWISG